MKFVCDQCTTKYSIDDARVRGKVLKIRCKQCNHIITVREETAAPHSGPVAAAAVPSVKAALSKALDASFAGPASFEPEHTMVSSPAQVKAVLTAAAKATLPSADEWFVSFDGQQEGPFSLDKMVARIRVEKGKESFTWRDGFERWLPVEQVPEIVRLLNPALAPAPVKVATPIARPAVPAAPKVATPIARFEPKPPAAQPKPVKPAAAPAAVHPSPPHADTAAQTERAAPSVAAISPVRPAVSPAASSAPLAARAATAAAVAPVPVEPLPLAPSAPPPVPAAAKKTASEPALAAVKPEPMASLDPKVIPVAGAPAIAAKPAEARSGEKPIAAVKPVEKKSDPTPPHVKPAPAKPSIPPRSPKAPAAPPLPLAAAGSVLAARSAEEAAKPLPPPPGAELLITEASVVAPLPAAPSPPNGHTHAAPSPVVIITGPAPRHAAPWIKWAAIGSLGVIVALAGTVGYLLMHKQPLLPPSPVASNSRPVDDVPARIIEAPPPNVVQPPLPAPGNQVFPLVVPTKNKKFVPTKTKGPSLTADQKAILETFKDNDRPSIGEKLPSKVERQETTRTQVNDSQVADVVRKNKQSLTACYERELKRDNTLRNARIDVDVKVGISGVVTKVKLPDQWATQPVGLCLVQAIRRWHFPSMDAEYEVPFPLLLQAQ
ncbi:MAG: AgmX/PglI C-terminal domain-containing protein [Myxococcales bacterium]|nr:AgmX/PglI C-terminal domain-containing protein [Myxococcales bacterium]